MATMASHTQNNSPKDNFILNIFLVDKTGSMHHAAPQTVSGFQEFKNGLENNSDPNINVKYALCLFDTTVKINQYDTLQDMPDLVLEKDFDPHNKKHLLYDPSNMTALYDALHTIFKKWGHLRNCVLTIFTDGESNSDITSTRSKIFQTIRKLENENEWLFHYFGANIDAYQGGSAIGITNTTQCDADDMHDVFRNVSDSMVTMTRAQSQRQTSAPTVLQTPQIEPTLTRQYAETPLTQNDIDMLAPPSGLTRQVAQQLEPEDVDYSNEFDFGNFEHAHV